MSVDLLSSEAPQVAAPEEEAAPVPVLDNEKPMLVAEETPAPPKQQQDEKPALPSGQILMRASMNSLISKEWKEFFWLQSTPTTLLIFRSRQDMMDWNIIYQERLVTSPNVEDNQNARIKLKLDFYEDLKQRKFRSFSVTHIQSKKYMGAQMHSFKLRGMKRLGRSAPLAKFASRVEDEAQTLNDLITKMYSEAAEMVKAS